MSKTGISTECQKCATWKPPLSAAVSPDYHNGAQELNRISFTQRRPSPLQTAWVTLPKEMKGAGLEHMVFTKKDMRQAVGFHSSSPQKNTKQQDLRNVCPHCVTREGLCDHQNIRNDDWWWTNLCHVHIKLTFNFTWYRWHLLVLMLSYGFPSAATQKRLIKTRHSWATVKSLLCICWEIYEIYVNTWNTI